MKKGNVAIFVPHLGCPNMCSFCNQRTITSQVSPPDEKDVVDAIMTAKNTAENTSDMEIAFFGGSFTAIERSYMVSLLKTAYKFVANGDFHGIRISTRPDSIDDEVLSILKEYGVTAVELGAQSMDDDVLKKNMRGHTADDVVKASEKIKQYGFSLGLQMMTGLFGSNAEKDIQTAEKIISLSPDTVRIYPTVVLKGTYLGELFLNGTYKPMTLDETVELCAKILPMFRENNINVIRLGLHSSREVEENFLAGGYHCALGELVESKIMLDIASKKLQNINNGEITIFVSPSNISKMTGQRRANINSLAELGYKAKIKGDASLGKYDLRIENGFKNA